jgi:flagellar biosynthesis protein FlhG
MARLVPIASGKGGVGKSVIAANLGLALSRLDRTVVLVDLDLGGSNLHTVLGVKNNRAGLGSFIWKRERSLPALLAETGYDRLWLIPGDGLLPGTANLEWFTKKRIIKELEALPADYIILDLGAGSSYNVVDFFLVSGEGVIVIRPEITSVLNAYAFLKTVAFRVMTRSFPDKSPGRTAVNEFAAVKNEGTGSSYIDFARDLASRFPEGQAALDRLSTFRPRVVVNMGSSAADALLCRRLRDIAAKNLGIGVDFAAYIRSDPELPASVAARRPLVDINPSSPFSRGIADLASRLASSPASAALELHDGGDDIAAMIEEGTT